VIRKLCLVVLSISAVVFAAGSAPEPDARLAHAFRNPAEGGWIFVHLEGSPSAIGFQHGYLLPKEIEE